MSIGSATEAGGRLQRAGQEAGHAWGAEPPPLGARAYFTCFKGIVWREILRFLHQRERFLSALVRPLVWLFIFAAGFRQTVQIRRQTVAQVHGGRGARFAAQAAPQALALVATKGTSIALCAFSRDRCSIARIARRPCRGGRGSRNRLPGAVRPGTRAGGADPARAARRHHRGAPARGRRDTRTPRGPGAVAARPACGPD